MGVPFDKEYGDQERRGELGSHVDRWCNHSGVFGAIQADTDSLGNVLPIPYYRVHFVFRLIFVVF